LSLSILRSFVQVVDRGSFTGAAKDLGCSQPTLSRHISDLERIYQVELLVRTTRSIKLTKAGELMYQRAVQMISAERSLKAALGRAETVVEGHVHACTPTALGAHVVGPYCDTFLSSHPHASLDLRFTDAKLDLNAEGLDVALRVGVLPEATRYAQLVTTLKVVIVAEAALARRIRFPSRPSELASLPWVGRFGIDNTLLQMHCENRHEQVQVTPQLITDQAVDHRDLILQGAGAGVIEEYAVRQELDAGRLVQLLPEWSLPEWPVHLILAVQKPTAVVQAWCSGLIAFMRAAKEPDVARTEAQRLAA
jgi:DNA-binding transcriptional LysR family regulator